MVRVRSRRHLPGKQCMMAKGGVACGCGKKTGEVIGLG
jgi:hypothetical protein